MKLAAKMSVSLNCVEIEVWDTDLDLCCILCCEVEGNPDEYTIEDNIAAAKEICRRINAGS